MAISVDDETMNTIRQAMGAQAALESMGYGMKRDEADEFAREMERRDAEGAAKQSAGTDRHAIAPAQTPPKSSRRHFRGMRHQQGSVGIQDNPGDGVLSADQMALIQGVKDTVRDAQDDYMARVREELSSERVDSETVIGSLNESRINLPYVPSVASAGETNPVSKVESAAVNPTPDATPAAPEVRVRNVPAQQQPVSGRRGAGELAAFAEVSGWPSQGLAYPGRIYGQALTLVDMFILGAMSDDNSAEMLDTVISRHVRGTDPGEILACDEVYLMHWIRASSYPKSGMYGPAYVCDKCGHSSAKGEHKNYTIGFSDLVFRTSADPAVVIGRHRENGYVRIETYDGRECDIYLRRRRHDIDIANGKREWEQVNGKKFPKYLNMPITMAAVVEIEDCDGILDKMHYICEYPASRREELIGAISESSLSTKVFARVTCPECGGVAERPYPFRVKEFLSGI